MVRLGVPQEQSKALLASGAAQPTSRVSTINNQPVVVIDEGFDRAWRRVGLALDRTGFTVEDRDRNAGTYFVRYVPPNPDKKEPSFLSKLLSFRGEKAEAPVKYRITLKTEGQQTTVSVQNEKGAPETSPNAKAIVQVIADDLK
jgi:outer membrane protein assembly factor BamC